MKQVIVLCASVLLGLSIVKCLIGGNDSILGSMRKVWNNEVSIRNMESWR